MKVCITWLAVIGLAVWNVGCGSSDPATPTTPSPGTSTSTELGAPGGIESGSGTSGMDTGTATDDTATEAEAGTESDGPVLPETTDE